MCHCLAGKTQIIDSSSIIESQDKVDWNIAMKEQYNANRISGMPPNYKQFIGPGDFHCAIPGDRFWYADSGDGSPVHLKLFNLVQTGDATTVESTDCHDRGPWFCRLGVDLRNKLQFV